MKITEVTQHPGVAMEVEFTNLLSSGEDKMDEMIAFVMNDKNANARRLHILRRIDELLGDLKDNYSEADLDEFMHDQGPSDWRSQLRKTLADYSAKGDSYSWSHNKKYPPGTQFDFSKIDDMSDEEMIQFAKDMKVPPYHLSSVDETEDDDTPTGEYEICQRCGGEGCIECEEGLKDITGVHKALNLDDYLKGE